MQHVYDKINTATLWNICILLLYIWTCIPLWNRFFNFGDKIGMEIRSVKLFLLTGSFFILVDFSGWLRQTLYNICKYVSAYFCCGAHGEEGLSRTDTEDCQQKKKVRKHFTRDTRHTPHTHETLGTQQDSSGIIFTEIEKHAPKRGLDLLTALGCPWESAAALYLSQHACITQQQIPPALQIAVSD